MSEQLPTPTKLAILWTSADPEAARNMVFMYAYNSIKHDWWSHVSLILWGPASPLAARDSELQEVLAELAAEGIELLACKACADNYGVSGKLEELGINVKYMGEPLTQLLKDPTWATIAI